MIAHGVKMVERPGPSRGSRLGQAAVWARDSGERTAYLHVAGASEIATLTPWGWKNTRASKTAVGLEEPPREQDG